MVDGTTPKPPSSNMVDLVAWINYDSQVVHLLCQAIEKKILKYIMSLEAIWNKLKKKHDQWPYESIHHVQQQFFDITMEEGENITNFLAKIEAKNEFTNLGDNTCIDGIVMAKVFNHLPTCYKPFQLS